MLSRAAAPKIYDILLKMKLEAPPHFNSQHFMSQLSPPSSPHPAPTMLLPQMPPPPPSIAGASSVTRDSVSSSKTDNRSVGDTIQVENANEQLSVILDKAFNSNSSLDLLTQPPAPPPDRALPLPPPPPPPPAVEQLPPRPPSTNPWDIRVKTVASDDERPPRDGPPVRRRPPVEPALQTPIEGTSPVSPYTTSRNFSVPRPNHPDSARSSGLLQEYTLDGDEKHSSMSTVSSSLSNYSMSPTQSSRPRAPSNHSATTYTSSTPTIPEEMTRTKAQGIRSRSTSRPRPAPPMYSPMPYRTQRPRQPSHPTSSDERVEDTRPPIHRNGSLSDSVQQPISEQRRLSDAESLIDPNPLPVSTRGSVAPVDRPSTANLEQQQQQQQQQLQQQQPGLELARRNTGKSLTEPVESGLIPVDSSMPGAAVANLPPQDTSIDNFSSFYVQKQFCAGATDVINGGIGVKRQKKPVVVHPSLVVINSFTNCCGVGLLHDSRRGQMHALFV